MDRASGAYGLECGSDVYGAKSAYESGAGAGGAASVVDDAYRET